MWWPGTGGWCSSGTRRRSRRSGRSGRGPKCTCWESRGSTWRSSPGAPGTRAHGQRHLGGTCRTRSSSWASMTTDRLPNCASGPAEMAGPLCFRRPAGAERSRDYWGHGAAIAGRTARGATGQGPAEKSPGPGIPGPPPPRFRLSSITPTLASPGQPEGGMDRFPFSKKEWRAVRDAARAVAEAVETNDPEHRETRFAELQKLLKGLRERHGDHPALLETEADFTLDAPTA